MCVCDFFVIFLRVAEQDGFWFETCKQEVDERPRTDSFIICFPILETCRPHPGTWGCPALHLKKKYIFIFSVVLHFVFCKCEVFLRTIHGELFFFSIIFPLLNKTNCFMLHNTIKPLHVQYQCPITDYMYGKLHVSQISCIKKIWVFYWKKVNINRQAIKYLHV